MSILSKLYSLQELDSQLIAGQARLNAIQKELAEPPELANLRRKAEQLGQKIEETRTKIKDIELQIGTVQEKYSNSVDLLYSGKVNNPKELEDLQAEVDSLIKRKESLDEHLLLQMEIVDPAVAEQTELIARIEEMAAARADLVAELKEEQLTIANALKVGMEKRKAKVGDFEKPLINKYQKILRMKGGVGVAKIRNTNCLGCNVLIPAGMANRVKRGEILECPNCSRIMYHP